MPFDPDAYLSDFNPDAYLAETPADPVAANETLTNGLLRNATPEQSKQITSVLSPDDLEFQTAAIYYNQKFGTNHPPEQISAHIEYEYGEGATAATANAANKKAAKHQKAGIKEVVGTAFGAYHDILGAVSEASGQAFSGAIGKLAFRTPPEEWKPSKKILKRLTEEEARARYKRAYDAHHAGMKTAEGKAKFKEDVADIYSGIGGEVAKMKPEWVKESKRVVEEELSEGDAGFLKKGVLLVSQNFGNLVASGNVAIGFPIMYSQERKSMDDELKAAGLSVAEREGASALYGAVSGSIEYVENLVRIKSAFGKKAAEGGIKRVIVKKLASAGINVGQEVVQQFISNVIYNYAITKHNESTGENIPLRALPEGLGESASGSLAMTTILEMLGLSAKGVTAIKNKIPFTQGDATRVRKQNTDEQITEIVQNDPVMSETPERAALATEMLTNPSEQAAEAYNADLFAEPVAAQDTFDEAKDTPTLGEGFVKDGEADRLSIKIGGLDARTGSPIRFNYVHNPESASKFYGKPEQGDQFDRHLEPSGKYITPLDSPSRNKIPGNEYDIVEFKNPLVIEGGKYREASSWKKVLSDKYGGLTGKKLSQAIVDDGYDGIITTGESRGEAYASETVDLTSFKPKPKQEAAPAPDAAKQGDVVGISRKANNEFRAQLAATELDETAREKQTETLQKAIDDGIVDDADLIAVEVNANPRELKAEEVAGMLARKAQLSNEIEVLQTAITDADIAGDTAAMNRAITNLGLVTDKALAITTAVTKGAAKNARAVAAMAMNMDRTTFSLVNVITEAVKTKGTNLTAEERAGFEEMTRSLRETEAKIKTLEAEFDAKLEAEAQKRAEEILSTTLAQRTTVQRRANASKKREQGKDALKKLQWEVNDITGVPFKVARAINDIAVSHILDGATTLDEVVKRVKKDVPDARVTSRVIYDSMGGRVKKEAKKAKSDAFAHVAELKKQARLQGQIADAMEGVFDPKRTTKPTSAEVKALRDSLKEYRDSFYKTEADTALIEAVEDRIAKVEDMIERAYRPIKSVKTKSPALQAAEAKLKLKNQELNAQDRIALLEELLRSDVRHSPTVKGVSETTERLEKLRARITILEELRKNGQHEASMDERIDDLTREVESFTRDIKPKQKKASEYRADELKELQKLKRGQDQIAELLETIRTRKVSEPVARAVSSDKAGYEATKKQLREEMRKESWYQDQKEARELDKVKKDIAELDRRLAKGDYEGFITPRQERIIASQELIYAKIQRNKKRQEINRQIRALKPKTKLDIALEIYELSRSAKLSFDVGHIGRQGGYALSNWRKTNALKFGGQSLAAFWSQENADLYDLMVDENPNRMDAEIHGLHIIQEGQAVGEREYVVYTEGITEKITDKLLPAKLFTRGLKASERAQKLTNLLRMSLYDGYVSRHPEATSEEREAMASYYNAITGYGNSKFVDSVARNKVMAKLFTSVRFTTSRYQTATILFDPSKMKHKNLRKEMLEDAAWFYGTRAIILAALAAALPDDEVEIGENPDHSTIGRVLIHMDNDQTLVLDLWAGVQRTARVARALSQGEKKPLDAVLQDIGKSAHVTIGALHGIAFGKKYPNEDISRGEAALRAITPIPAESLVDAMMEDTPAGYVALGLFMDVIGHSAYTVKTSSLRGKTKWEDRNKKK